jgi:protein phosphatase
MFYINETAVFTCVCQKQNNEDKYGYVDQYAFYLCDGVGGQSFGEVASSLVVNTLSKELEIPQNDLNLSTLLETILNEFLLKLQDDIALSKMATTLTLTILQTNHIIIAWSGDSRVYQFREGNIIFQTEDHSWVNEAIKNGIINHAESFNHPNKHVLTKAIQQGANLSSFETKIITDIKEGDLFFHCSDGVLESWNNSELKELFNSKNSCQQMMDVIQNKCLVTSKDNSTAILYKIGKVI